MQTTQIEKMANTLADNGYTVGAYDEWDLLRMLFLIENDPYYYDDIEKITESYEEVELYEVGSLEELAEQFVDEGLLGEIPENIASYIDYDAIGRDLSFDGYYDVTIDGTKYIGRVM